MNSILADPIVRLVVCGNADRGDDGVALATIATILPALPRALLVTLDVRRCVELRVEDLVDLPAGLSCLIVDAVVGPEPGTVVTLTLGELVGRPPFTPRSSHQLPIDLAVGLAGILRDRPVEGTFVGLAGRAFGYGTPLSRVAQAAMPAFGEAIEVELYHLAHLDRALAPIAAGEA